MLTEEQMQQMDAEVKQRGMGINPDVMPVQDEADNYALTPEAAAPEEPMPQEYAAPANDNQEDDVFSGDAYITGPAKIKPNMAAKRLVEFTDQLAADVKKTNIYKRYAYSKEDVLREAREISIETGIPERAILYSPQTLDNARNVFNYRRRQMDLMPPGTDEVNIDLLTKAYPGLKDIVDNGSEVDAAIALQNIKNVRQVNGLVDAAKTRWQAGWMQHEIANVGRQALRQGRAITDEEFARADKITKQIEDLRETPSFVEDPLLSIVGGTAEQVPQQLRGVGTGALFGTAAAATALTVGAVAAVPTGGLSMAAAGAAAKTAFGWGMRAGYAVDMWEDSAAQRYIEYSRFKDKDGRRVLTDEEARAYAAVAAAVETGIEFMNAGKIVDVLKGNKSAAARQIRDAVAGATDNATFAASLKRILSGMGEIAVSESLEEGGQEASDRILSNVVASFKGGDIPKYTPGEILTGAVESFAASLPATIGFGLSAAGGGSIGLVRRAAAYAELNDLHVKERMKNLTGINMIQGMVQDAGIKEFFRKDTDIAKQVLHNTVEGTGYEKVNIDTQMVLDQEGGMNALQEIGKAAGMSADEIQHAVETKADITVPTETYFQMRAENENFAINENLISFSDTAPCFARNQYYANMIKSELDSLMQDMDARQVEQQQAALDMIVQRDFAEGLEQDAAASILAIRPDNPMEGWREMRGMYKQQLDEILAPVIRELKSGMKQGVEIRRDESERDTKYIRESQNADWARKFYAENKRWPTQFELEGMAIDILSGRDFSKLPDYQNRPEMQEFYDSNAERINDLLQTIEVFDGIREKIAAIDPDELQTMEGMSKEAYDIYRNVAQQLQASAPNDAVRRSAKAGAALLARRADRFAEAMRAAGNTNYTAADYFRDRFGLRVGGTFQGGGANTLFQTSEQLNANYPNWQKDQTTNTGQHSTQIAGTKGTYLKIGNFLKENGMENATILDASSGLGYGTQALREAGFDVEDVEPYPSESRESPTYISYADIPKQYDVVISNAVLNVIPDDWRAGVLHSMANAVKTGGRMIINVRDAREIINSKQKIELDSPSEILVTDAKGEKIRAYQKGFTQTELSDWVKSELGPGWEVQNANKNNSGLSGARAVVAIKTADVSTPDQIPLYQESPDGSVGVTPGAVELNAATARDKDTQDYLRQIMAQHGLKEKDQQNVVLNWIEKYVSIAEELLEKHPSMKEWHEKAFKRYTLENGLPVPAISAFKNNGEYEYNIDLGSLCTKREALDSLIQLLVDKGMSQKIGPTQYTALSDMLAEMGFLTHCKICFVEGKRVRVLMDANKFSFEWRSVLRALGIDDDNVVGDERHFTPEQMARLEAMTDVTPVPVIDPKTGEQKMKKVKDKKTGEEKLVPETEKAFKLAYKKFMPMYARRQTGDAGITPDKMFMIAKLFKENSSLAGIFKPEWLQTSRGTSWLIDEFGTTTSIKSVLASMYGAATSKPLEYFSVYDPLSWAVMFDKKKGAEGLIKHLYDIGGVRAQSFTDFNPMLFVDYVQMVADLAVRKLPMHVYTKVPSFVKLFGETGMMINMSLVARVDPNTDAEHAGLVWNPETKEWDYAWADESFPVEEAFALRQNPEYGGRVGTIAVALSDEHMKKLLADPRIDQVIPFHKSGMSEEVLAMTGLNRAKDFTNEQTEKNVPKGMSVISYNALLQEHKDPKKATAAYLEWCDKNGVTPTFKDYINNPNYYKLQEDFRGYDNNNKPVIQGAVRMQLPENAKEILDEAWAERGAYMEKIDELKNNPQFIDKAMKRLEPQHIDGEVRKEMLRRLRNIMGSKNVITLQQGAFLDALEKSEAQTMGQKAAKNHVEIFRNGQGIVYGFTHNGKIYLNENTMNANTPAHEFTHVWVQVARKVNPKLWNHGKSMLKDTYEWVQVTHDPLYKNIRGDEEAIASEVLARIVGRENESFVRDFMDKGQLEKQIRIDHQDNPKERDRLLKFVKYGTGKTLRKQIMDWFKELWGSVRSLFDPVKKGQYPTYDEFIHMPLKDLWDSTAEGNKTSTTDYSKRFSKALSEIYKNGGIEDMPASEYGNRGGNRGMEQVAASATELQAGETLFQRQQRQGDTIQGATQFEDNGRRIISIFESGNESTMAHELGHIFVADLKELAEMPNAPAQIVKDWETVKKWIGWKNGQKNFTTAQQEKFARGFEAYLRSGEAPATGLKKVFRDFKRWLTKIYKDFLSLGGKPSADVQAVMGRMLATEQEVENAFKVREAENFEKAGGFDYLAKDSQEMYQRWQNEAQEYAKEKVLAQAMKDLKAQRANELAAVRDQMEQDIRAQLQQEPLYQAEALVTQNPKIVDMWPAEALGMTYDEYTQAIAEQGTLDKAVQTAVDAAMKEVEEGLPEEEIKQAAEAAVNSSEYRGMYLAFEQDFIEKKLRRDETLNNRIEKALADIEKTASGIGKEKQGASQTVQNLRQKINELKYQARWTAAENDLIRKIELAAKDLEIQNAEQKRREQLSELREEKNAQIEEAKQEGRERLVSLREEKNAQVDELRKAISDFRNLFKKTRQDVRVYRDTAVQKYKLIKQYAADNMAEMPISDATNVAKWAALEKRAGRESIEAMKRAIDAELKYQPEEKGLVTTEPASDETLPAERKAKESPADLWRQANEAKLRQRVFAEYAAMAQKNKDYIRKKNARLQARSKTIAKNNNMPANERYMYNHGLYVLGLNKQDAPMPQEPKSIMEMIQGYKDNLQAFFVDEDGNISMPDYAISAMTGNTAYNGGYQNLTMEQYQYFNDMLTAIYKAGIDANKVKSMKDINGNSVLISDVNAAIVAETNARVSLIMTDDVTNAGTPTFAQSIQNKARRARVELTKPETILDMMGPTAYRYIYETVNQSWNKEQGMLEESAKVMQSIWAPYSNTEKSEMRSKKQYRFGTSILTKEEMICVAFNWGTEINRKRIMDGFGVDEMTVNELLSNLTQKDWQMVTSVWELVNSYWPETARVEESMTGIAPQKQTAMPFEITGKDGQVYKLQGGYYPIKYDPSKSLKAANQQQDDMAKQYAANNAAMNRNRGFTKQRVQGTVARPVLLSFNVLNRHISDVVHNICFRESLRDVNRIIKSPEVSQVLQDHFGIDQTRALEQWVRDCWAPDVAKKDVFASSMEFFRHKQTAAALGYRMTTAALNALNIYPMTDYLGATRTVETLQKFYSDPKVNWDFAVEHSIFLRQRAETMDRDAGEVLRKEFVGGYGTAIDTLIRGEKALEKHAFDALAFTDMLLAAPLWTAEYQRVYQEMTADLKGNMDADAWFRIEMEAVAAGDKAVRKVFGSGEMKDLAPVQKGGEITKALTMFYSYFNVVFNALYSGYGEGRRQAMGTDSKILIAPLAQKFVFWIVLTGVTEGLMRTAIDALSGNGGDEPEDWMKAMFKGVNDNIAGTIPVFRDMWSRLIDRVMGERDYGSRALPAYTVFDNILKLSNTISSDKKSKIDVFREGAKITNGMTGIGNTVTDAIATTAYWADTDFDAPLYQYLAAVFFDKRLDRKKKK